MTEAEREAIREDARVAAFDKQNSTNVLRMDILALFAENDELRRVLREGIDIGCLDDINRFLHRYVNWKKRAAALLGDVEPKEGSKR